MAGVGAASHTRLLSCAPGPRAPSHTRRRPRSPCWAPAVGKALTSGDLEENLSGQRDEPLNPEELGRSQCRGAEWPGQKGGRWDWTARLGPLGRLDAALLQPQDGSSGTWLETRRPSRPFGLLLPGAAGGHRAPVPSPMTAVHPREPLRRQDEGPRPCCGFFLAGSGNPRGGSRSWGLGSGPPTRPHAPPRPQTHHPRPTQNATSASRRCS